MITLLGSIITYKQLYCSCVMKATLFFYFTSWTFTHKLAPLKKNTPPALSSKLIFKNVTWDRHWGWNCSLSTFKALYSSSIHVTVLKKKKFPLENEVLQITPFCPFNVFWPWHLLIRGTNYFTGFVSHIVSPRPSFDFAARLLLIASSLNMHFMRRRRCVVMDTL